jgi:hypothetical protein
MAQRRRRLVTARALSGAALEAFGGFGEPQPLVRIVPVPAGFSAAADNWSVTRVRWPAAEDLAIRFYAHDRAAAHRDGAA